MLRAQHTISLSTAIMAGTLLAALAQHAPPAGRTSLDAQRALGTPRTFRNLTLIPVYNATVMPTNTYLTLDEGLKSRRVTVKEARGGGDVNTLYITNISGKPLYVMAGEVVLGGQQDRCLARDTIIPPGKRGVPITVFCVEHGRWVGHSDFDSSAPMIAGADIRKSAQEGEFQAEQAARPSLRAGGSGAMTHRRVPQALPGDSAAIGNAQEQVWDKVAGKNQRFGAAPASGTYREVLSLTGGNARQSVTPYINAFAGRFGSDPHLVGAVAAVNGKIVAADVFGDPTLFRKLWPKLLRSYAADAAENASVRSGPVQVVTAAHAKRFLREAASAKSRVANRSDVGTTLRLESGEAVSYQLMSTSTVQVGGRRLPRMAGGGGGAVHESTIGK